MLHWLHGPSTLRDVTRPFHAVLAVWLCLLPGSVSAQMIDRRHAVAPSGIGAALVMNPKPVEPVVFSDTVPGQPGFWGWTDFHALYPIGMEYIMRSLADLENQAGFCPHVALSECLSRTPGDPFFHEQLQRLAFDYVIYKQEYHHVIEAVGGTAEDGAGLFLDYRLSNTLSGGLTYCAGSWYLRPMVVDGREYTYARFYMVNCVQDLPGIVKFAMRTFPGLETPATMNSFYRHAVDMRGAENLSRKQ